MSDGAPIDVLLAELSGLRAQLVDADSALVGMAPGVAPGVDVSSLHPVRESTLAALASLQAGHGREASTILDAVLPLQWDAPGRPWDGTFPTTAEQPTPPDEGAVEWLHYDPNWRQFIGAVLALIVDDHGPDRGRGGTSRPELPAPLVDRIVATVGRCARGEPGDRIPTWYTNPDLLHAWVQGWAGARLSDPALLAAGQARAGAALDRVRHHGDVDEYSSPTYDGVDLLAAALWAAHPPAPDFEPMGQELLGVLGRRISTLYHPGLGAMCGPYIRTYGMGLDRYVALLAIWFVDAGWPRPRVLPVSLGPEAVHVHDLFFAPVVASLGRVVRPHLQLDRSLPRRHVQTFGDVEAVSVLTERSAFGAERGRRPDFARDQHAPLTVHTRWGDDGPVLWMAALPGDGVAGIDAVARDPGPHSTSDGEIDAVVVPDPDGAGVVVRTLWSHRPTRSGERWALGSLGLSVAPAPTHLATSSDHRGSWVTLTWPAGTTPRLTARVGGSGRQL